MVSFLLMTRQEVRRAHKLVRGDDDMEMSIFIVTNRFSVPELPQNGSILRITPIRKRFEIRDELCDFLLPVVKGRCGRDDEERSPNVVYFGEVSHEGDRLNSLSETHLFT